MMGDPEVFAVVVTYNPPVSLLDNMEALAQQAAHVAVIDNGTVGEPAKLLQAFESRKGFTVIRNGKNLGIAAALNAGIHRGIESGAPWTATFDQDNTITPG